MIWLLLINITILVTGVVGTFQNAKGNRNFFYVTIVFVFANIALSLYLLLYAEAIRFVIFFFLNFVAFLQWGKQTKGGVVQTTRMNPRQRLIFAITYIVGILTMFAISLSLQSYFETENGHILIFIDAFLAVTETIASIFMIKKNVACIYLWTICNIVWIVMLTYLLVDTGSLSYLLLISLRFVFISANWWGYSNWLKQMPQNKARIEINSTYPEMSKLIDPLNDKKH